MLGCHYVLVDQKSIFVGARPQSKEGHLGSGLVLAGAHENIAETVLGWLVLPWRLHVSHVLLYRIRPPQICLHTNNPLESWNDHVRKDLESLGLALTWWRQCQDRPSWKAVIEMLLRRT